MEEREYINPDIERSLSWKISGSGGFELGGEEAHSVLLIAASQEDGGTRVTGMVMASPVTALRLMAKAIMMLEDQVPGVTAERIMAYYVMTCRAGIDIEPEQIPGIAQLDISKQEGVSWPGIFPGSSDPSVN